ncbi:winged helix-turn-helix transcriptional regulator [Streptomyces brasiliensis]|uniref:Transcriptional regulator n=1 Tax=Streptomyces brasiliensis TaxID=1954 RepID=A0A917L1P2_9ACTN|nr:winged helix-turn-helix transcriptional regulator [Streptomyces brasiliensis]GGJ40726.1 transcriptional regulator [Streptomyces brasiliensis]
MLDALGISDFDERIYRALLAHGEMTAQEAAEQAAVSPGGARRALARLAELGLVRRTSRARYQPARPEEALTALLTRRRLEAESAFDKVRSAVEDLRQEYRAGRLRTDPGNLVEVLSGRDVVMERMDELRRTISTHLWVLDKPPYVERVDGDPHSNDEEKAQTTEWLRRGVEVRSIYCPESMERPGRFDTVLELTELGEKARLLPRLPFKLHIVDRKVALVPLIGGGYDGLAVVRPSGLLDALIELYEAYWARAEPIRSATASLDDGPSREEALLLSMLKAGLKDQAIARQLGWSPRTVTRKIAALMTRLGADTRFQAGIEATARRWI